MKAVMRIFAGGVGLAALIGTAAPAAAQYYPGYGGGGDILSTIINSVLGQNRSYGYGYDPNRERYLVERCARATEARIQRSYNRAGYGYGGYGYSGYSTARIVGISRIERRANGGIKIYGTASSGQIAYGPYGYGAYGAYGYGAQAAADLRFDCTVDYYGRVRDIDLGRNRYGYGY